MTTIQRSTPRANTPAPAPRPSTQAKPSAAAVDTFESARTTKTFDAKTSLGDRVQSAVDKVAEGLKKGYSWLKDHAREFRQDLANLKGLVDSASDDGMGVSEVLKGYAKGLIAAGDFALSFFDSSGQGTPEPENPPTPGHPWILA